MKRLSLQSRSFEKGLSLKPREIERSSRSIKEIIREASKEAQALGLTEDILREILNEQ